MYGSTPSHWSLRRYVLSLVGFGVATLVWFLLANSYDPLPWSEPAVFVVGVAGMFIGSELGKTDEER
jgi:xanthosine utilization system XapX-like protein